MAATVTCDRADLCGRHIAEAIAARGKELAPADTVATARELLANHPVRALPVLDGETYLGAVDSEAIAHIAAEAAVGPLAAPILPTALASTPTVDALAALDLHGGQRLVVLGDDGTTYVGLVCMRRDRERVCVAAPLAPPKRSQAERTAT